MRANKMGRSGGHFEESKEGERLHDQMGYSMR